MYRISDKDIASACFNLGRRAPITMLMDVAHEIVVLSEHFKEEPPKGLDSTFYHTLDYEKELEYYNRLKTLVDRYKV